MKVFKSIMKWACILIAASGVYTFGTDLMNTDNDLWFYVGLMLNISVFAGIGVYLSKVNNKQKTKTKK